jgi:phosphatidylserine/phosphatidylglycerophosphate/cardiolipin synthase-like enzyme
MSRRSFLLFALAVVWVASTAYALLYPRLSQSLIGTPSAGASLDALQTAAPGSLSLITEPQAGITPVLAMIENAQKSIDLVMYQLADTQVENALVLAQSRGVAVRVLLNRGYFGKKTGDYGRPLPTNQPAYDYLQSKNIPVRWTPASFALTHQKTLVEDGAEALIMTFNLTPKYYPTGREFGIIDTDAGDVSAIEETFNNDWQGALGPAAPGRTLVWSPGSELVLVSLIAGAQTSLDIYNEEMADPVVTHALEAAAARGVDVKVDMTYASNWKAAFQELVKAGVHVRTYASSSKVLYIHAKMILVDGARAFVGSENFSAGSLDDNRELGLILSQPDIIASLARTFASDWAGARPFVIQAL